MLEGEFNHGEINLEILVLCVVVHFYLLEEQKNKSGTANSRERLFGLVYSWGFVQFFCFTMTLLSHSKFYSNEYKYIHFHCIKYFLVSYSFVCESCLIEHV